MAKMDKYDLKNAATFTFYNNGDITEPGTIVSLYGGGTVAKGFAEDKIFGKAWKVHDNGTVTVQYDGIIVAPYTGSAPDETTSELVLDGNGGVKIPATSGTGTKVRVVDFDATDKQVAFIIS